MNDLKLQMSEERDVLRWGGLAGIVGGIVMIVAFAIVAVFVGTDPAETPGTVQRFPDIRAARTVENSVYLVALMLWMVHFLALYRALRATNPAAALFGSVLGVVGLAILAAGALPHVALVPLSDLYHAPGATPEDQARSPSCGRPPGPWGMRCSAPDCPSSPQASSSSARACSTRPPSAGAWAD